MTPIAHEFAIGGVYMPPLLVASLFGALAALLTARLLNRYRLSNYFILSTAGVPGADDYLYSADRLLHYRDMNVNIPRKYLLSGAVVLIAVAVVLLKYRDYVVNFWTRDGQVRADVIQITPRVSGPIVRLPVIDNQFVKTGELLFEIDPRTFAASLAQAQAQYDSARDNYVALDKQVEAELAQVDVSRAAVLQAESAIKEDAAEIEKNDAEYKRQKEMLSQEATSLKAVQRAKANYRVAVEQRKEAVAGLTQAKATLAQSEAALAKAKASRGAPGDANAIIRAAQAAVEQAQLDLEFT